MEFMLFYRGSLPANGDKKEKHRIRSCFHPQLENLWQQKPLIDVWKKIEESDQNRSFSLAIDLDSHTFVPLVTSNLNLVADLTITMLRPGLPGELVSGGDIDNRLKTLFDALRMPKEIQEIPSNPEPPLISPQYCLLEDDRLITDVKVSSRQLLKRTTSDEVILLITILVKATSLSWDNIGLSSG